MQKRFFRASHVVAKKQNKKESNFHVCGKETGFKNWGSFIKYKTAVIKNEVYLYVMIMEVVKYLLLVAE